MSARGATVFCVLDNYAQKQNISLKQGWTQNRRQPAGGNQTLPYRSPVMTPPELTLLFAPAK
jgi:hypothetical protein